VARIHPDGWRAIEASGAAAREIETLALFEEGLSNHYTVFHGVRWSLSDHDSILFDDIDFALVNPAGDILLIEQKSGFLVETARGLVKRHGRDEILVTARLASARAALAERLERSLGAAAPRVDSLFYCPDYTVIDPGAVGIDPSRLIDASHRTRLIERIREILPEAAASDRAESTRRFLANELRLVADAGAVIGESRVIYQRLSGGLALWARRLDFRPFRLRVIGTAGSGKTQLALQVLRDAIDAGRSPLYVCYNRPLADHIARLAPAACLVATYHQLCERVCRAAGMAIDFSHADVFRALEDGMANAPGAPGWRFDELIIDEGQDFLPEWRAPLLAMLRPEGRAWWLEDPYQNLYDRANPDFSDWVTLRADINYRSPRSIMAYMHRLGLVASDSTSGSPITGGTIEILDYDDERELLERTKTAITRALGAGFHKEAIAVLTFRGRDKSRFSGMEKLGPHVLRTFTGQYDLFGKPVYNPGELLVESLYRFKGQSAPCVILTEIDFEALDERARRKLFVGLTRATLLVILVASRRARVMLASAAVD
jgi:hypothetical protein